VCDRCKRLEDAILAIDAKAASFGAPIVENGEEYASAYLIPAGVLHRALGIVGHSAAKVLPPIAPMRTFPAEAMGVPPAPPAEPHVCGFKHVTRDLRK